MQNLLVLVSQVLFIVLIIQAEYPYCFRFTWIGPFQDKNNIASLSCAHLREDLTNIPCRSPLVATDNDLIPDTLDLWHTYRNNTNKFGCPMTPGQSCIKYTYIYNKGIQNITYMCAKVNASNGCYRQRFISGLDVEVCVCESQLGMMPCNLSITQHGMDIVKLLILNLIIITLMGRMLFKIS